MCLNSYSESNCSIMVNLDHNLLAGEVLPMVILLEFPLVSVSCFVIVICNMFYFAEPIAPNELAFSEPYPKVMQNRAVWMYQLSWEVSGLYFICKQRT